jgi:hypothetical protein
VETGEEDRSAKGNQDCVAKRGVNDAESQIFIITVDETDCNVWERKHTTMPIFTQIQSWCTQI